MRVTWGGTLDNLGGLTQDVWQNTVNCAPLSYSDAFCVAYLDAIQEDLVNWFAAAAKDMSENATLDYVKANLIDIEGHYDNPGETFRFDYAPGFTGGKAPTMPGDLSLCISWRTALARGRASKGRIYPPNAPTAAAAGSNQADSTSITHAVTAGLDLLTVLASSSTTAAVPGVYSGVDGSYQAITGVRVGDVVDVQRRRRNARAENYQGADWP